jgi:hypothetical protein
VVALVGADSAPALMKSHRVVSVVRPQQHGGEEPADGRRPQHDHGDRDNEPGTIPQRPSGPYTKERVAPAPIAPTDPTIARAAVTLPRASGTRAPRPATRPTGTPTTAPTAAAAAAAATAIGTSSSSVACPDRISNTASPSMKHAPRAAPAMRPTTKLRSSSLTVGVTATGPSDSSSERGSCPHPNGRHATPCGPCGEASLQSPACLVSRSRSISLTARRSPKCLVRPTVQIDALYLPSHLELRSVWCGGVRHRR